MPHRQAVRGYRSHSRRVAPVPSPLRGPSMSRTALLAGTSLLALLMAAPGQVRAAQLGGGVGIPATTYATDAAALAAQQAAAAAQQSQSVMRRSIEAIQAMQGAQAAARAAAAAAQRSVTMPQITVPNGLAPGGLQVAPGGSWSGANAPVQSTSGNGTTVTIDQTAKQAILNWQTFNVGARTTVNFNQQGRDWTALNRVIGNTGPSQILGQINAPGQVLVINQNGIIFGGASQINVGSLIASTANITDQQFLTKGIYSPQGGTFAMPTYEPSFTGAGGRIVVENGALITTSPPSSVTSGGGFVALLGTEVRNAGTIITPKGQALLAAGDDFVLRAGLGTTVNLNSTTRGSEVAPLISTGSGSGAVANTGLIFSQQGDITLAGRTVIQDGVLLSTTSVNQRGTIHLLNSASDGNGSVTLTAASLALIMPELESSATALNSQRDALIASAGFNQFAAGVFNNLSKLADRPDQSRIEIVSGGIVNFQNGSQTIAQGGQVAVTAGKRVFTENGATLDVSGVRGVVLPMSSNIIKINIQGNELRDSPQNRDNGALFNQNVWIDARTLTMVPAGTGGYASDRYYTAGGLLEAGGYLANTAHTIGEWTAVGGTITLAAPEVIAQRGATFNISGGSVAYQGGFLPQSYVLGSDGRVYNVNNAPADLSYSAVVTGFVVQHKQGGRVDPKLTEIYASPLGFGGSRWEDGYTVGRDAGKLILSTPTPAFEGAIIADVVTGERQVSRRAAGVTDGYKLTQSMVAQAGTLALGQYSSNGLVGAYASDVRFGTPAPVTPSIGVADALPSTRTNTAWFDAGQLSGFGLGGLTIATKGSITIDAPLTLANGAQANFMAPVIDIGANVTAPSGNIAFGNILRADVSSISPVPLTTSAGLARLTLHAGATIDARGRWSNAAHHPRDLTGLAFIDGGRVTFDSTQDVTIARGSLIDVSSGGAQLVNGKMLGGKGGSVTLVAEDTLTGVVNPGKLNLDGEIRGYGVNGGGTLTIEGGPAISIGGKLLAKEGVLGSNEAVGIDLTTAEAYSVKTGEVLPFDFSYLKSRAMPGEPVGGIPAFSASNPITLAADWKLPPPNGLTYVIYADGVAYRVYAWTPITLRAGQKITRIAYSSDFPTSYVLPADVFPKGIPIIPTQVTARAGSRAPSDVTFAPGQQIAAGTRMARAVKVEPYQTLKTDLFSLGFSSYVIDGHQGVAVADGAKIQVSMPVYRVKTDVSGIASGASPSDVFEVWTPPVYLENPLNGRLTQRAGASIALNANGENVGSSRSIYIGTGSEISVDPGQSIRLGGRGDGQIVVDGTLNAWGGLIAIDIGRAMPEKGSRFASNRSIWIGGNALLDVAARAAIATDAQGRTYGMVADGGTITIGGGLDWEASGMAQATDAFVIIRPGAVLDASGARARIDVPVPGFPPSSVSVDIASNGGSIVLKSNNGLFMDGTLRAAAGSPGASGGTLALALETPSYELTASDAVRRPRELILASKQGASGLAVDLRPNQKSAAMVYGSARLGIDTISAGGFDNLSLLVNGVLSFDGDMSLHMNRSLRLYASAFGLSEAAGANSTIDLAAPYFRLAGATRAELQYHIMPTVTVVSHGNSEQATNARLSVTAGMIDIRDSVGFGAHANIQMSDGAMSTIDRRGFAAIDIASRGDMRFLKGNATQSGSYTDLTAPEDLTITAGQIYPATEVNAQIRAGNVLTIRGASDVAPAVPWSVFGKLSLDAPTIVQGGVLRAPGGGIEVGRTGKETRLMPGSITSVSMAGLQMPYGGTVDGLTYTYDGREVRFTGILSDDINSRPTHGISVGGAMVAVESGALLDLSGGGNLLGAGFVSGRGGSVDVLRYTLADANPAFRFSSSSNKVYAIVPGFSGGYAPVAGDADNPAAIGQQVTISTGVPGLAAGTYTLLPSTYALLPGAFRVEVGQSVQPFTGVAGLGTGSYVTVGTLGIADTNIRRALPTGLILTPGAVVRTYSSYNETSYGAFGTARAKEMGWARPWTAADASNLSFVFKLDDSNPGSALRFDGKALLAGDRGGSAGQASVRGQSGDMMEILAPGTAHRPGYISIDAEALNGIGASRLVIGGSLLQMIGDSGHGMFPSSVITVQSNSGELIVRSGAVLSAPEAFLVSGNRQSPMLIEAGASINTLGRGRPSYDSSAGFLFDPQAASVVAVSNGWLEFLPPKTVVDSVFGGGNIIVGACPASSCAAVSGLYSEGTIAFSSQQTISIADTVRYGTKNLVLAVSTVNIGSEASLADAAGRNVLAPGLSFNQGILERLLSGNRGEGIPRLESLILTARQSINFFGTVNLSTLDPATGSSSLRQLVLSTPAIYGYGQAGDVATLATGNLVWTGIRDGNYDGAGRPFAGSAMPAAVIPGGAGTGHGRLTLVADTIELGYADRARGDNQVTLDRLMLGFGTVDLTASRRIGGNAKGTLSVYETQNAYVAGKGYSYSGGNLNLITPLLTGAAGSVISFTAGGELGVLAPQGAGAAPASSDAIGATLALKGETILLASAVALPSGKLTLSARGDITLADAARIDMSGRAITMFDVTQYSWGGDVTLESSRGNVVQAAGSVIDLSAVNNQAGKFAVTALGDGAGRVDLAGIIRGTASGRYDVGAGVRMDYLTGRVDVRGQTIADFAGLNQRLGVGGVFGERSFQVKQGDLVVGDELKASAVNLSIDGGRLTVVGRIDASGERVGAIRLAARDGITLGSAAVLDAHGTALRIDSDGKPIDAPNRAIVELTSSRGMIALQPGAIIDVRSADGVARGTLALNATRRGGAGVDGAGSGANDIAIDARGPVAVHGAKSITVNGFRRYTDAPLATETDAEGRTNQVVTQGYLDGIHGDSDSFITAARNNASLMSRLSGLSGYRDALHLRPGVEIASDTPDRGLTVAGDLDLSRYRYDSINPGFARTSVYGSGEPGALIIRASGDLGIYGSINDGFKPVDTPDGNGWVLTKGVQAYSSPTVLSTAVTIKAGSVINVGYLSSLNYDVPIDGAVIIFGIAIPIDVTTAAVASLPAGTVVRATITLPDGEVIVAGTVMREARDLPAGTRLAAGTVLHGSGEDASGIAIAAVTVPKGTPLDAFKGRPASGPSGRLTLSSDIVLKAGAFIPSESDLILVNDAASIDLRPTGPDGKQGQTFVVAPMLASGSLSWDIGLVAGSDLGAADRRMLQTRETLAGRGNMVLSDRHYMPDITSGNLPRLMIPSVIRTGTGDLSLRAGGNYDQASLYGIYTAGTQSAPILNERGGNDYNLPRGQYSARDAGVQSVLGPLFGAFSAGYEALVTGDGYQAWYPEQGGNLVVVAQGNMAGTIQNGAYGQFNLSSAVPNWLWRQGSVEVDQKTAWWINFGTYASSRPSGSFVPQLPAFSGFGALGGGNVAVTVGGNAGVVESRGAVGQSTQSSTALQIAVGATGRVLADGSVVHTGGGDISLDVGGAINPLHPLLNASAGTAGLQNDLNGGVVNLRGAVDIRAGTMGRIDLSYGTATASDPRAPDLFAASAARSYGGMVFVLGDASLRAAVRGDLVVGGMADPGFLPQILQTTPYTRNGVFHAGGGTSLFSLQTAATMIDLVSAGGNVTPLSRMTAGSLDLSSNDTGEYQFLPSRLHVVAASGGLYLDGGGILNPGVTVQMDFLARQSIYGGGARFNPSGADPRTMYSLGRPYFTDVEDPNTYNPFEAVEVVTNLHRDDPVPLRFYAGSGDIVGLSVGQFFPASGSNPARYYAAKPVRMLAGRDLVNVDGFALNNNDTDISRLAAGRDIIYANFDIAGPGTLEVLSGRNLYQADKGTLTSVGPVVSGDTRPGASILTAAGIAGAGAPNYAAVAARYLDPVNLADPQRPLADQLGKVAKTYEVELVGWLGQRFGFAGTVAEARAYFDGLAPEQQHIFLRQVYFAELTQGGREYNDSTSRRFGSYLRGRQMIAALFPDVDADGQPIARRGDITMFGGSGVRTLSGGAIQTLVPGGKVVVGVDGLTPTASAGLVTQGRGDIQIYSRGSVLLGLSRIMTTFGGHIIAWSAEGDINAGRGSKTTQVFTPSKRVIDRYGNVTLSPQAPATGAGIATLPFPEVPRGDVDLVAPLGTIDVGEAGIRFSGNLNLAALQVVNAANISGQGTVTGVATVQGPPTAALTAASNTTAASQQAAPPPARNEGQASIIMVEVLGYGGGSGDDDAPDNKRRAPAAERQSYNPDDPIKVVGYGPLSEQDTRGLTEEERRKLVAR